MMSKIFTSLLLLVTFSACSPKLFHKASDIDAYRQAYKEKFDNDSHAPLKGKQLDDMRFYDNDDRFKVQATIVKNPEPVPFDVNTSSGMIKQFHKFADAYFTIDGQEYQLEIYQNMKLIRMPQYRDYLFLPFNDLTNGEATYGGGRYIDLKIKDIKDGKLVIDFNKCYNPYCAYRSGYNCPIPPLANKLDIAIEAGEKLYAGDYIGEKK